MNAPLSFSRAFRAALSKSFRFSLPAIFFALSASFAFAQETASGKEPSPPQVRVASVPARDESVNFDVQVSILEANNNGANDARLSPELANVVRTLHQKLPYQHYALGATTLFRVKSGEGVSWSGMGNLLGGRTNEYPYTPTFSNIGINRILGMGSAEGLRANIVIDRMQIGLKVPVVTAPPSNTNGIPAAVNYENTGITTGFSLREGVPTVVGTLNGGANGGAFIVIVNIRRAD